MKEFILQSFMEQTAALSVATILINYMVALALGLVIYISYRFSHSGAVYSARFNVSLVMLVLVTTLVMNVIGNNIALSLGMVGALSIIRFRTAIKDPRDATYIFWCIAVGICCGVSEYIIASIGCGLIFLFLLIFGSIKANDRYLLVVHAAKQSMDGIEREVLTSYAGCATLRVKNSTIERVEYIYEISARMLKQAEGRGISISDKLYQVEGVVQVNLVCQNEEISR